VLSLVSIGVLGLTWYGWQFVTAAGEGLTTTDVFADSVHAKPLDGAVDILLVGQDSRTDGQGNPLSREVLDMLHAGQSDGERQTDTMILVHIPQNGKQTVAFSFPRDSRVEITGGFGKHKLNSAYVYAYNDKSRTLQQDGKTTLTEVVLSSSVLTSPAKISDLVSAVKKSVVLSSSWNLLEFAEQMRGLTSGNIEFHTIPTKGDAVIGGADVVRVDIAEVRAAIDNLVTDAPPAPAPGSTSSATPPTSEQALPGANAVTVDLFDGSGNTAHAREPLQGKGFRIGDDTWRTTRSSTVLRYAPGDETGFALVKQALDVTIKAEPNKNAANGHVSLGNDFSGAPAGSGSQSPAATSSPVPASPTSALPGSSTTDKAITAGGVPCVN
jgi:anionic cell wall polymer biosynthesis LytR-Cps2A-Psr (LCP) family protein